MHALEAAEEQPRANEQQHREGDFGDDENRTKAMARCGAGGAAAGFVERFAKIQSRSAKSGHEAEQEFR